MKKKFLILLLACSLFSPFLLSQTIYVNHAASGSDNGSSWENAYQSLTTALAAAHADAAITQIWVAKGTYYPSVTNNRDDFFDIRRNNLQVYAGFAGTETELSQRNVATNPTILSGNIGAPASNSDNSYHVMVIELNPANPQPIDNSLVIDGFTFSEGNAGAGTVFNDMYPRFTGSAIFISCNFNSINITPLIRNCTFLNNRSFSSGALSYNGISSGANVLKIEHCVFQNNYSGYVGAALDVMQLEAAGYPVPGVFSVIVDQCSFLNNSVDNYSQGGPNGGVGAGINTFGQGTLKVNHSRFIDNTIGPGTSFAGTYKGTAVSVRNGGNTTIVNSLAYANNDYTPFYNMQSTLTLINATAYNPGGSVLEVNNPIANTIGNSILWTDNATANVIAVTSGSPTININNSILNTIFQGTVNGSGILTTNPLFIDPATGNFGLQAASPAINAGDNTFYTTATNGNGDLTGNHRIAETTVDIGAYEANSTALPVTFESIWAGIKANRLLVNWTTTSETNNDHFEIEASSDGKHFEQIAVIATLAADGNSSRELHYEHSVSFDTTSAALGWIGLGFLSILFMPILKKRTAGLCILLAAVVFFSCRKNNNMNGQTSGKLYIRIAQVDKDGSKQYSKIITAINQ